MSETNSYTSALGFLLLSLRYTDHLIGKCKTLFIAKYEIISDLLLDFMTQPISKLTAFLSSRLQSVISLVSDTIVFESLKWSSRSSVASKFVACYGLMTLSIILFIFILRNASSSFPDVVEETDRKPTDNLSSYEFPSRNKSPQMGTRGSGLAREDLRSFVTVKAKEPSVRKEFGQHFYNNRSPGVSDYYVDSEVHSMISDNVSEFSNRPYDINEESIISQSVNNPSLLIGWQINIKGRGVGLILDIKKSLGRTTKYEVQFEDGTVKLLKLKRSSKKGDIPFSLIMKAN